MSHLFCPVAIAQLWSGKSGHMIPSNEVGNQTPDSGSFHGRTNVGQHGRDRMDFSRRSAWCQRKRQELGRESLAFGR